MSSDLLQPFQVLTQLALHSVRQYLGVLAINNIALPVKKPRGNLILGRVLDDRNNALELFRGNITGTIACQTGFLFAQD